MVANNNEIPDYEDFVPEFLERIQATIDEYLDTDDIHTAFVYLVAELFESTREDRFTYTDGSKDGGIDFFIQDVNTYSIYQCKCPDYDQVEGSSTPRKFDKAAVQETLTGINTVLDENGTYDLKPSIARLRTDYHRDLRSEYSEEPVVTVNLAVFGELTQAAIDLFNAERQRLKAKDVDFNLYTWKDIYKALHELDLAEVKDMKIELKYQDKSKEVLSHDKYVYMLAYAKDFVEAWRRYEWNLFDLNVRLQIHQSQINKRIIASLKKAKSQRIFHHLNNGITITCKSYKFDDSNKLVRLIEPQIINGCQTVCAIRDAFDDMNPQEQKIFEENTRIQVKVIANTDPEFIGQIVITTNDQNPMAPRNLKSNSAEQKKIQTDFRLLADKWFYERKQGEWKSLVSSASKINWFRRADYVYNPRKRYRVINNELLAKIWFSWIGNSNRAVQGGLDYFDNDEIYNKIFRSVPKSDFWDEFSTNVFFSPKENHFSPGSPTTHQYLLAYIAYQVIKNNRFSRKRNRDEALERGVMKNEIEVDSTGKIISSKEVQDYYLASDSEYKLNNMINNMNDIMVELYSFLLTKRYGELNSNKSRLLLEIDEISLFKKSNFLVDYLPTEVQDGSKVFGPMYAFLKDVMRQYAIIYQAEIAVNTRFKGYLFNRRVTHQIKELIVKRDKGIMGLDESWKPAGKTFLDSLPNI
jgi:hypothetical protein